MTHTVLTNVKFMVFTVGYHANSSPLEVWAPMADDRWPRAQDTCPAIYMSAMQISTSGGGKKTYAKALSTSLSYSQRLYVVAELESICI